MRILLASFAAALLLSAPAHAKPPREESPPPREMLQSGGSGNTDEELEREIAAAQSFPLGTLQNPVRVAGPDGERNYLARLRCADGSTPSIGAGASGAVDAYGSVSESFAVTCPGMPALSIVMDMYHEEHVETRAPAGFHFGS